MSCQFPGCSKAVYPGSAYCSKSHRDNIPAQGGGPLCQLPGCSRPAFPGGTYCSKAHRDSAPAQGGGSPCQFPGCSRPAFPGGAYCSKTHRDSASTQGGGSLCQFPGCSKSAFSGSTYCSKTHRDHAPSQGRPTLVELSMGDSKYQDVENQFVSKWLHGTPCPTVHRIYTISLSHRLTSAYNNYRASVERTRNLPEGNQRRRFHGTNRACNLGDNGSTILCNISQCSLCSIIRASYQLSMAGGNKPWLSRSTGRLGHGIYTSATSSKSNDYSENLGSSPHKAMLLNKVVVGNGKKIRKDQPNLTEPPQGYDSVIGEPANSGHNSMLNYDELVVYKEEAIIPAYLIIYNA